ncbi:MAG: large subunit ribosomal protein L4 [Parcubacteria group bacterium Greene0416_14]|nr:MAG: large subunit ribosomal protein L4 [Parcubacteria group bacterium Greene0416_14]TSD00832.1 MAG: large subunit ribosomal protein L4 [Parcubacteria group bacterium Greene1014_15]
MEATVYNLKGEKSGTVTLPGTVFGVAWNGDLVHQVVTAMQANARTPVAHTKNRGEVSGGGKKPWRQKGTGRARHGSIRSPIWIGGGVTHGPRKDKNYAQKINKKMRSKALYTALSQKMRDNEILFVDHLFLEEAKTKEAKHVLGNLAKVKGFEPLATKRNNSALIALDAANEDTVRGFRNLSSISTILAADLNPVRLLTYKYLIVSNPEKVVSAWGERMRSKKAKKVAV